MFFNFCTNVPHCRWPALLRSGWEVRAGEAAWTEDSLALEPIRGQRLTGGNLK